MTHQHKSLADGRWNILPLVEQMAHIGSEVERAISWRERGNKEYSQRAFERALELLHLSINDSKNKYRLRELTRVKEALLDYFLGDNQYNSYDKAWRKYFYPFAYAVRNKSNSK